MEKKGEKMTSRNFEQELEDTVNSLQDKTAPSQVETRPASKVTAISGARVVSDPLDTERLIAVAQQKFDHSRETLNSIELEHQLERTKSIELARSEIAQVTQKLQRSLSALDQDFERRKEPARKMMELVSRLTNSSGA